MATQLVLATAHLIGVAALFVVGRRMVGEAGAWTVVSLYAGSAYLLEFGGARESVGGLPFVSHVVPASATLVAFAALDWPFISGLLLATAVGAGFYPVFFWPLWTAWQWQHGQRRAWRFVAGFAVAAAAIGLWVLAASQPARGLGLIETIVRDTLGHHADPNGYGLSRYGLWGQQTGALGWLGHPLIGAWAFTTPFLVLLVSALGYSVRAAMRTDRVGLPLLTAAAAISANLWKIHATATYVAWYYPFLVLGLVAVHPNTANRGGADA